jgi:triacylglycerol lipase
MSILVKRPEDQYCPTAFAKFSAAKPNILNNARAMMWLSQLGYETDCPKKVERIGQLWQLASIECFHEPARSVLRISNTRGVIAEMDAVTIICFAGTDPLSLPDWIADLRIQKSADELHQGFSDAVDAVWKDHLEPVFAAVQAAGRALMFAGHSLGGALAVVAAERALQEGKMQKADIYTFGMPRVGTAAFTDQYEKLADTTYRFIHGQDIVPTVPPTELGFLHVGHHLHCSSGEKFVLNDDLGGTGEEAGAADGEILGDFIDEFRRLAALPSFVSFRKDPLGQVSRFLPPGIGDHLPDRYCNALSD